MYANNYIEHPDTKTHKMTSKGVLGADTNMEKRGAHFNASDQAFFSSQALYNRDHEVKMAREMNLADKYRYKPSNSAFGAIGNIGAAVANAVGQVKSAIAHTVGQIGSSVANALGLVFRSNFDMKARKAEADSAKKQKFLNMAAMDSTEYYKAKASVANTKLHYKNNQKQRQYEAKKNNHERSPKYSKSRYARRYK